MKRDRIAAQLYTVRDYCNDAHDLAETLGKVRSIGYKAVELSSLGPLPPYELKRVLEPDSIEMFPDLAIIATVGIGMIHCVGFAGRLCAAVAQEGINLRVIDLGASEDNMIIGLENRHFETAIRAIYREFVT
jgi:hypothetical protein